MTIHLSEPPPASPAWVRLEVHCCCVGEHDTLETQHLRPGRVGVWVVRRERVADTHVFGGVCSWFGVARVNVDWLVVVLLDWSTCLHGIVGVAGHSLVDTAAAHQHTTVNTSHHVSS